LRQFAHSPSRSDMKSSHGQCLLENLAREFPSVLFLSGLDCQSFPRDLENSLLNAYFFGSLDCGHSPYLAALIDFTTR
jgi:hypothetical protein